jgi:hypothetical protein
MVDTATVNGTEEAPPVARELPDMVTLTLTELQRFPSPGTQRALKAETGRDYLALVGETADSADRTQTQVWQHLRRTIADLRWSECADIELQFEGGPERVDPSVLASSMASPRSVVSGA